MASSSGGNLLQQKTTDGGMAEEIEISTASQLLAVKQNCRILAAGIDRCQLACQSLPYAALRRNTSREHGSQRPTSGIAALGRGNSLSKHRDASGEAISFRALDPRSAVHVSNAY